MSTDYVPCARCGQDRLPPEWYKSGYEWLGHGRTPCIGAEPQPRHPSHAWFYMGDGEMACRSCHTCPCHHPLRSSMRCPVEAMVTVDG